MPQSQERLEELLAFERVLNTDDGQRLIEELSINWDGFTIMGETPQETGHRVGLRDAFKYLIALKNGDLIADE